MTYGYGVGTWFVSLTLAAAAITHLFRRDVFRSELREQGLWPHPIETLIVWALPPLELALGIAVFIGWLSASRELSAAGGLLAALLFSSFAGVSWRLWRSGSHAHCACGPTSVIVSGSVVMRAIGLTVLALTVGILTLVSSPEFGSRALPPSNVALIALSGVGLTMAVWTYPGATARPRDVEGLST